MKKKKIIAASSVAAAAFLCCGWLSLNQVKPIGVQADELFVAAADIKYEYNADAGDGEKGILISTDKTVSVDFKNTYAGVFELSFATVTTEEKTVDFYTLNVDVQPTDGGNVFRFTYTLSDYDEEGKQTAKLRCYWGETPIIGTDKTFAEPEKTTVGFDSETMTMYYRIGEESNYTLMDFHDSSKMASGFSTHNRIADVEAYNVSLSFAGINPERTAKVMLYSINGQKLMGKSIVNHKGADVVRAEFYAGVVGKEYVVRKDSIVACDALNGVMPFDGKITAQAPDGTEETVKDGKFIPTQAGTYLLTLQAKDNDGVLGTKKVFSVNVLARHTETEIEHSLLMKNMTVGKNTPILLSSASAYSKLFGGKLPVSLCVKLNGETVYECADMTENKMLSLTENGNYTVEYSAIDSALEETKKSYQITVSDGYSLEFEQEFQTLYFAGDDYIVPNIKTNAESVETQVFMPDGRISTSKRITLSTLGRYTVRYILKGALGENTVDYAFKVETKVSDLFETNKDMKVQDNAVAPDYMDVRLSGAMLSASLVNATATYKNTIDLTGKTKNDLLAELYVCPEERLTLELKQFSVRITDVYDESNYVTVQFSRDRWNVYNHFLEVNSTWGENPYPSDYVTVSSSLYGKYKQYTDGHYNYDIRFSSTLKLYWDNAENAIYLDSAGTRKLVRDLDDANVMGVNTFKGFKTGEVKFSVVFDDPHMTAHVLVSEIAGQSLSGDYVSERIAPSIAVQWSGETPNACIGKAYPVFEAYGLDCVDGRLRASTFVYLCKNGVKERVLVSNGAFTPTEAGVYEIVYRTVNSAGQAAQKILRIEAKEEKDLDSLTIALPEYPQTANQGENFFVGAAALSGGSGYSSGKIIISLNGTEIGEYSNADRNIFLEKAGTYTFRYVAEDVYTGMKAEEEITVSVVSPTKPVFEALGLPEAFIVGKTYELPMATAYDYSSGERTNASVKLYVNGEDKTASRTVKFDAAGVAKIEYKATNADNTTDSLSFSVPLIDVKDKTKPLYLSRYFIYDEKVIVKAEITSLTFLTKEDTEISFINFIPVDLFSIKFSVPEEYANLSSLEVVLTDSVYPMEKAVLSISRQEKASETSAFAINGVKCDPISGIFGGAETLGFSLKLSGNTVIDGKDNKFNLVNNDGSLFDGFTSGWVSVDIRIVGVEKDKEAGVSLSTIVNQTMGNATSDRGKPNLLIDGDIPLFADLNTQLQLPKLEAYDVLDPEVELYVSVMLSGQTLIEKRAYTSDFTLSINEYGKYNIIFYMKDGSGREQETPYVVNVYNRTAPTLTLSTGYAKTASVGQSVKLATAQTDGTLEIAVSKPNGTIEFITDGKITIERKGTYRVIYYAYNADGAVTIKSYEIIVK